MRSDTVETLAVTAPTRRGQDLKELLDEMDLRDPEARIRTEDGEILIPVKRRPTDEEMATVREEVGGAEVVETEAETRDPRPSTLEAILEGDLEPELLELLPSSFDVVGDIAVLPRLDDALRGHGETVGLALMRLHPSVETVLEKETAVSGEFRVPSHRWLAGVDKRETVHREHGCEFRVNVEETYFSPRLSTERERVFEQVRDGEFVVDMFTGVGPFAIEIARHRNPSTVVAMDKNPEAFRLLVENVEMNGVGDTVQPVLGDAREAAERYGARADRVIMNLPKSADAFLDTAVDLIGPGGGVVHYYEIAEDVRGTVERVRSRVRGAGREPDVLETREVRTYSATQSQFAVDVKLV